jgi:hypothetical protein
MSVPLFQTLPGVRTEAAKAGAWSRPFLLFMALAVLGGCASMTPEQCKLADWRQIGYADGAQGLPGSRIDDHAKACAEVGVRPNLDEYLRGRSQGLFSYCQPENGFTVGRRGAPDNAGDCPASMRFAFLEQYQRGQEIHAIESDLERRRSRLDSNYRRLRSHDERIGAIRGELAKTDLPADRRTALSNELNRLADEKNTIVNENAYLRLESDRLQSHLYYRLREMGR